MDRIVTLPERKAAEPERRRLAMSALRAALTSYARALGGRFLLVGSAGRGAIRYDSDVDILVNCPRGALDEAWSFAERACRDRGLDPDHAVLRLQGPLPGPRDARPGGAGRKKRAAGFTAATASYRQAIDP